MKKLANMQIALEYLSAVYFAESGSMYHLKLLDTELSLPVNNRLRLSFSKILKVIIFLITLLKIALLCSGVRVSLLVKRLGAKNSVNRVSGPVSNLSLTTELVVCPIATTELLSVDFSCVLPGNFLGAFEGDLPIFLELLLASASAFFSLAWPGEGSSFLIKENIQL